MPMLVHSWPGVPYKRRDLIGFGRIVLGVLNAGGMGIVYLVSVGSAGQLRALKTFQDRYLGRPEVVASFYREADIWQRLGQHIFLVPLIHTFMHDGRPYAEMEYIAPDFNGEVTLRDHINANPKGFCVRRIVRWGIQFCMAMEHAQSHGLVCHRDVKPQNLMVSPHRLKEGNEEIFSSQLRIVRLSDFGLTKAIDSMPRSAATTHLLQALESDGLCVTQCGCGTPAYMAPEQFSENLPSDIRGDIYAFGLVLYELSTGRHALHQVTATPGSITAWREVQMTVIPQRIESPLWPVIEVCLHKDPARRFQSIAELRAALDAADRHLSDPWNWPYPF